jgi:hypothetical protein
MILCVCLCVWYHGSTKLQSQKWKKLRALGEEQITDIANDSDLDINSTFESSLSKSKS